MTTTLVEQVTERLTLAYTRSNRGRQIDRAIELSDRFSRVKPQEYIVPLAKPSGLKPTSK